ncbi:polyprenyl synthetase family protein [Pseudoclavibacter sp. VKM Ac-2867]|uniref:polyprenyl synthetase family protein n=1 Tax=Pseudoclavibacter sp. VKM Ac-2867 TaxID=2783829 RepID=UPI00188B8BDB|nr:polyprenyl synthetase family protein [Pseudoclavibacter sp. VKM Ac-2867]MBF4458207.1 polyprenyl synthetase family protein [Pseudoclavibacter sp. VKM Ac-2867]
MSVELPKTEQRRKARSTVVPGGTDDLFDGPNSDVLRERLDAGLAAVETRLRAEVQYADEIADVTARYLLNAGGKRLRPMLTVLASQFGDTPGSDEVITAAAAVELTHLASLYHDDVMDEAELRRGVAAAHLQWGNSIAILAGDLLFARSSLLFSELGLRAVRLQATIFERLVLGQMRETTGPAADVDRIDHYVGVLADKTGSLISAAAQFGAIVSGAPESVVSALAEYGERVGVAFQLADDVIDLQQNPDATGKLAGTDLRAGVETLPVLLLERQAATDEASRDLLERIRSRVAGVNEQPEETRASEEEISGIIRELREHRVTQLTVDEAQNWVTLAVEALRPVKAGPAKNALERFAAEVVSRDR